MIVRVKSTWNYKNETPVPESFEKFFSSFGKFKQEESTKDEKTVYDWDFEFIGEVESVPIEILNSPLASTEFYGNPVKVMTERFADFNKFEASGSNISIHMPSNELLSFNMVDYLDDARTNELQRKIDDGFRIIACIPQVGQRRPDYILGKKV